MTRTPSENHTRFKEWLYLEADDTLDRDDRRRLEGHLTECEECRREARQVGQLHQLLGEAVIPVDTSLSTRVMANLPEAGWEAKSAASWRLALAVFALLAGAAALLGLGGAAADAPLSGAALALVGLFRSALVAGGGLLAASWTGLGLAVDELLAGSRAAFIAFSVLVLGVDFLFVRLLLRRRLRRVESEDSSEPSARH